jgi:hypothetical protein
VDWESRTTPSYFKADPSLKSFVFTLKNPHNFPARQFALKAEKKDRAIACGFGRGPSFGGNIRGDILVPEVCNVKTGSTTYYFGSSYENDSGLDGTTLFTGWKDFTVKEIEVFEITD